MTVKTFKMFLKEGGNAVKNVTRINQENVKPTMDHIYKNLLPKLGITKADTALLGSTGKKHPGGSSGDVDLAIDIAAVAEHFKTTDPKEVYKKVEKAGLTMSDSVNLMGGLGIVSIAYPIVNKDGKQDGERVQLDLMLTNNKDWSEYMYYSPAEWDSEWKGLYRNSALSAISHYAGRTGDDVEWNRKMLHFSTGLHDVNFSKKGKNGKLLKNGKEVSRKFVSQNPDEVIHLLLGDKFDSKDIKTWEDIFAAMESKDFEHKKDKKAIYKRIIKDIEHKGYPIPPELEKYR